MKRSIVLRKKNRKGQVVASWQASPYHNFLSHCDFRFLAQAMLCFSCWSVLRRNNLLFSRKGGRLEQSGNVRKACHSTWAGEGTALSVATGETEKSEANKERGSVSSPFLLPAGAIALHCGMLTKYGRQRFMTVCKAFSLSGHQMIPVAKKGPFGPSFL